MHHRRWVRRLREPLECANLLDGVEGIVFDSGCSQNIAPDIASFPDLVSRPVASVGPGSAFKYLMGMVLLAWMGILSPLVFDAAAALWFQHLQALAAFLLTPSCG